MLIGSIVNIRIGLVFLSLCAYTGQSIPEKTHQIQSPTTSQGGSETNQVVPTIEEVATFTYCALEMKGSYNQYRTVIQRIKAEIKKQNVQVKSDLIGIWYTDPKTTPEEKLSWELGYMVTPDTAVKEPLKIKKWTGKRMYRNAYDGLSAGTDAFFEEFWAWFPRNNLKVVRPLLEIDLPHAATDKEGKPLSKFTAYIQAENIKNVPTVSKQ